jgi:hypothetical protein
MMLAKPGIFGPSWRGISRWLERPSRLDRLETTQSFRSVAYESLIDGNDFAGSHLESLPFELAYTVSGHSGSSLS